MKKLFLMLLSVGMLVGCHSNSVNMSDEMKIDNPIDLSKEDGADSVERQGDHEDSMYYAHPDFYNMESTESLTILSHFQTLQQSSEWSCGVDSALMVLNYYDRLGDHTEESLAQLRTNGLSPEATSLESMIKIFEGVGGMDIHSTYDYTQEEASEKINLDMIRQYLEKGVPVMVAWNDWGGHWQTIIGYDDIQMSQFIYPALSTIHQSAYQMGLEAAQLIYKIATDQPIEKSKIELPVHYVARETIRQKRKE